MTAFIAVVPLSPLLLPFQLCHCHCSFIELRITDSACLMLVVERPLCWSFTYLVSNPQTGIHNIHNMSRSSHFQNIRIFNQITGPRAEGDWYLCCVVCPSLKFILVYHGPEMKCFSHRLWPFLQVANTAVVNHLANSYRGTKHQINCSGSSGTSRSPLASPARLVDPWNYFATLFKAWSGTR